MENQKNLLKRIKSIDRKDSQIFSMQHAQNNNFINSRNVKIEIFVKVLSLTQGTSCSLYKMQLKGI